MSYNFMFYQNELQLRMNLNDAINGKMFDGFEIIIEYALKILMPLTYSS